MPAASSDRLRIGVLGVADIAVRKVIPAAAQSDRCEVTAIASRTFGKARAAADRLGIDQAFGSYEELLAASDVDAVYIPLPNHLHMRWTLAAADAGKHVLCEKPLALTRDDAAAMVVHCERVGVQLMEAFMYRLHPLWVSVMARIDAGEIGSVEAMHVMFSYFNDDPANIRNQSEMGGGAMYDIGCYAVDAARMVFGTEPTATHAAIRRSATFGTDVLTSGLVEFDGRHALFTCATGLEPAQRVEVFGSSGRIVIDIPFNIPPHLPTCYRMIAGGDPPTDPHVEVVEIPPCDPYATQFDAFARAVRSAGPPPVPPINAVRNLAVIESILAGGR